MSLAQRAGRILETARKTRRLSRRALAGELRVSANSLREVELGEANPTLRRLEELGAGYGLEFEIVAKPIESTNGEK